MCWMECWMECSIEGGNLRAKASSQRLAARRDSSASLGMTVNTLIRVS